MIGIVDYGMGNLRSVQKAFERIGYPASLINHSAALKRAELIVLPGVGAFDRAVTNLKSSGSWDVVLNHLELGKPYLGVCLGLQLLFEGSEEGSEQGLGFFQGQVVRFKHVEPVPHMGWNEVNWTGVAEDLLPDNVSQPCYYFVHSYYPRPRDRKIVAATANYGEDFCVAVRKGECMGIQFHPEKSQFAGLDLLKKYCDSLISRGHLSIVDAVS